MKRIYFIITLVIMCFSTMAFANDAVVVLPDGTQLPLKGLSNLERSNLLD